MSLENWMNLKEDMAWKGDQVEVKMLLQCHYVNVKPCTDFNCKPANEAEAVEEFQSVRTSEGGFWS